LDELFASFVARKGCAQEAVGAVPMAGVEPFDVIPATSVDPREAWNAATSLLATQPKLPAGWSAAVSSMKTMTGLPMAVANYPQAVRDLVLLVRADLLSQTLESGEAVSADTALSNSAETMARSDEPAQWLLAAGLCRLAGRFAAAEALLSSKEAGLANEWRDAWANEMAALDWQRGNRNAAIARWNSLPETAASLLNRGMAELFSDRPASARPILRKAIARLNESDPWHHLGQLYLAMAESRSNSSSSNGRVSAHKGAKIGG